MQNINFFDIPSANNDVCMWKIYAFHIINVVECADGGKSKLNYSSVEVPQQSNIHVIPSKQ